MAQSVQVCMLQGSSQQQKGWKVTYNRRKMEVFLKWIEKKQLKVLLKDSSLIQCQRIIEQTSESAEKEKLLTNSVCSASTELNDQSWVCAPAVRKMFSDVSREAQERMYDSGRDSLRIVEVKSVMMNCLLLLVNCYRRSILFYCSYNTDMWRTCTCVHACHWYVWRRVNRNMLERALEMRWHGCEYRKQIWEYVFTSLS